MDTLTKDLQSKIMLLMKAKHKNAYQVSVESGVTYSLISDLIKGSGRVPRIDQLIKLAGYFDVSLDYLCGLSNGKTLDPDLKAAAEYSGLSEDAVSELHQMAEGSAIPEIIKNDPKHYLDSMMNASSLQLLSRIICHDKDSGFFPECALYVSSLEDLLQMKAEHPFIPDDFANLSEFVLSDSMQELSPFEARSLRQIVSAQAKRIPALQARLFYALREIAEEEVKKGELSPWSDPDT